MKLRSKLCLLCREGWGPGAAEDQRPTEDMEEVTALPTPVHLSLPSRMAVLPSWAQPIPSCGHSCCWPRRPGLRRGQRLLIFKSCPGDLYHWFPTFPLLRTLYYISHIDEEHEKILPAKIGLEVMIALRLPTPRFNEPKPFMTLNQTKLLIMRHDGTFWTKQRHGPI